MSSGHQIQTIIMEESLNGIPSKEISCSSRWHWPPFDHLWIWPQQIAHHTFLRHFSESINFIKVVNFLYIGRESSVNTEDLVVNNSSNGEEIEYFSEGPPDIERSILFDALIIEAIDLSN